MAFGSEQRLGFGLNGERKIDLALDVVPCTNVVLQVLIEREKSSSKMVDNGQTILTKPKCDCGWVARS